MQQSKVFDAEVCTEAGAVEEIAVNVVKHIAACEGSMQQQMEMMYSNMSDETFKDMRRVLPVSGVRFFLKGGCGGVPVPVCYFCCVDARGPCSHTCRTNSAQELNCCCTFHARRRPLTLDGIPWGRSTALRNASRERA